MSLAVQLLLRGGRNSVGGRNGTAVLTSSDILAGSDVYLTITLIKTKSILIK